MNAEKPSFNSGEILNALKYRYATKRFDPTAKIPKETFDTILEAARLAPTSMGFEPWKMIVLNDEKKRQAIKPYAWGAQNPLDNASHFIVFLGNKRGDLVFGSDYLDHVLKDIHQSRRMFMSSLSRHTPILPPRILTPWNRNAPLLTGLPNKPIS